MSVDLSLIIPNECRSVKDKEHARQYFEASMERIAKYFHGTKEQFITDVEIIEEEEECFEITYGFEVPLLNISVYMHSGYWDIWPVSRYSQYFYPYSEDRFGKPRIWARNYCFNALLAFGRKDGWICDEYHSWNSSLDTDSTFEDWKIYENDTEDGTISEFNLMDFADVDPENQKWPDYQAKYHDDFKECHANLDVIKQMFPDYEILSMGYPLSEYALAAKEEGLYLLNMETGESLTDYPFTNCNANFNGAGVQLFRGKESAFFNCIGKQLTNYRVGDFSWEWDSRDCNYLGQIVTDKATGKRFLIDGTPMPDKNQ